MGGNSLIGILFALLAGLLMSVQGVFNTRVMDSSNVGDKQRGSIFSCRHHTSMVFRGTG